MAIPHGVTRRAAFRREVPAARVAWTPGVAESIAREAGLRLTADHWLVLGCAREECLSGARLPDLEALALRSGVSRAEIEALFPGDAQALVCRIAGLDEDPCGRTI